MYSEVVFKVLLFSRCNGFRRKGWWGQKLDVFLYCIGYVVDVEGGSVVDFADKGEGVLLYSRKGASFVANAFKVCLRGFFGDCFIGRKGFWGLVLIRDINFRDCFIDGEVLREGDVWDFRDCFRNGQPYTPSFNAKYNNWLKIRGIERPDIMFVGAYTRYKNVEYLVRFLEKYPEINGLIISDRCPIKATMGNMFIFNKKVVAELDSIHQQEGIIGFVAMSNISVPTSTYVYANYNIPILAGNYDPVASIVRKYGIGEVFDSQADICEAFLRIKCDYKSYQIGMKLFNSENCWDRSQKIHREVINEI